MTGDLLLRNNINSVHFTTREISRQGRERETVISPIRNEFRLTTYGTYQSFIP